MIFLQFNFKRSVRHSWLEKLSFKTSCQYINNFLAFTFSYLLSVCLSVCLGVCLSVCLSLSLYIYIYIYLNIYLSIYLYIYIYIYIGKCTYQRSNNNHFIDQGFPNSAKKWETGIPSLGTGDSYILLERRTFLIALWEHEDWFWTFFKAKNSFI